VVLDDPAGILQKLVDLLTGFFLGFHDVICSDPKVATILGLALSDSSQGTTSLQFLHL
jgi:hypothetical protein